MRRKGIGGSDAAAILGISPYKSILELWEDKTERSPIEDYETDITRFGHIMEPIIRAEFTRRTGLKVRQKNAILQSEDYPFMMANLDGIVKDPDGNLAIFEAKTASEYKRDVWEERVPEEYIAQLQHYFAVTGLSKAYIAAVVGGNTYYCYIVYRDEAYIEKLIKAEAEFWNCVVSDTQPPADSSEATQEYLNKRYLNSRKTEIVLPEGAEEIIGDYKRIDAEIKELTDIKSGLSNSIKAMMQENEVGRAGDSIVKWSSVTRNFIDSKKLKEALGESYTNYLMETKYRKLSIA